MIHKIKALGLALVAMAVMGMTVATMAPASELHLYNSTNITGQQTVENSFTTDSGSVHCTQATFEGTLIEAGEINELTLTGIYTGCKAYGLGATVDMNGCKYTVTGAGQPSLTAEVDITGCTTGRSIEITAAGSCVVTVPEQHSLGHAVFQSAGSPSDVAAQATIQGITYETHGACPSTQPTVLTHNGQYTGQVTVKAFEDNGSEKATHNGHQYDKLKCGDQIGLLAT